METEVILHHDYFANKEVSVSKDIHPLGKLKFDKNGDTHVLKSIAEKLCENNPHYSIQGEGKLDESVNQLAPETNSNLKNADNSEQEKPEEIQQSEPEVEEIPVAEEEESEENEDANPAEDGELKVPNSKGTLEEMQNFLKNKNIPFDENAKRPELYEIIKVWKKENP